MFKGEDFNKNPKDIIKKATLVTGFLLTNVATVAQQSDKVEGNKNTINISTQEIKDSTLYKEAENKYEKKVEERKKIIEQNKLALEMNQGAERIAQEIEKFILDKYSFTHTIATQEIPAPSHITQKSAETGVLAKVASFLEKKHILYFKNHRESLVLKRKEETILFKDLNKYTPVFEKLNKQNKVFNKTQDFFSQYSDKNTKKSPDVNLMNEQNHILEVLRAFNSVTENSDPKNWKLGYFNKDDPEHNPIVNGIDNHIILYNGYEDSNRKININNNETIEQLTTSGNRMAVGQLSMQEIMKSFVYKGLEPKNIKIKIYDQLAAQVSNPNNIKDFKITKIDDLMENSYFAKAAYFILVPIWEEKPVPKLPIKDKFISDYIASRTPKDTVKIIKEAVQTEPSTEYINIKNNPATEINTADKNEYVMRSPDLPNIKIVYNKETNKPIFYENKAGERIPYSEESKITQEWQYQEKNN